jgi:hypothetical protein
VAVAHNKLPQRSLKSSSEPDVDKSNYRPKAWASIFFLL